MRLISSNLFVSAALSTLCGWLGSGCQAAVITDPQLMDADAGTPAGGNAREVFDTEVAPLLMTHCAECHENAAAAPLFLDPSDYYASVLAFRGLVVPGEPSSSSLITKGGHQGPAWEPGQSATIGNWIILEGGAGPDPGPTGPSTSPYPVDVGANRIPLSEANLPGAELVFSASRISSGMLLADIAIVASSTGVAISSPRFAMHDGALTTLDDDAFADVELRVSPGMTGALRSSHVLVDFPADGELSIRFESAAPL